MGSYVPLETQKEAAEGLAAEVCKIGGVEAEIVARTSGTNTRSTVSISCPKNDWRVLAERLKEEHGVDYCSMITGIHWPEGGADKNWEVVYHFLRMGITDPPIIDGVIEPDNTNPEVLAGRQIPLEIEVSVCLPETDEPSVATVQDIWAGADWNEKETWDLVGIDFEGHVGMRRVLQPHETPVGFHPLQKQHKLRYHDFEEMYDDAQGFLRKPADAGKIK
ncbi:MAG TPA: NADH-quinone oxidoreductase subunit C [Candidatus Thalassarchaeaceae archaeon]|nr:NADH-quinone oxidoreductase subunit C [Candidatus Thalassarchaeaceae archaeon]|tara:strand:+ start:2609 stop:3268 length:660 start_codon:yes stop_codon:yes gene_type:complete